MVSDSASPVGLVRSAPLARQDDLVPGDSAPLWLRPIHTWFFWWEVVVPSLYRVAAVAVGAAATAALLFALGVPLLPEFRS